MCLNETSLSTADICTGFVSASSDVGSRVPFDNLCEHQTIERFCEQEHVYTNFCEHENGRGCNLV